jgi:hypothetical protein
LKSWINFIEEPTEVSRRTQPTLQRTNIENLKQIFIEKELFGYSPDFHIHVSVSDLYIPTIDLFCCRKYVDRSWDYLILNRLQTHECGNWD